MTFSLCECNRCRTSDVDRPRPIADGRDDSGPWQKALEDPRPMFGFLAAPAPDPATAAGDDEENERGQHDARHSRHDFSRPPAQRAGGTVSTFCHVRSGLNTFIAPASREVCGPRSFSYTTPS